MTKKPIMLVLALPFILGSCVIARTHVTTGNPVGTKVGYVKASIKKDFNVGIAEAARQGKITKIGSVDTKWYMSGKVSVRVTGE